ncbi:HBL115Cp [Eremothecium sinecaudum]|uniref:HBL115Cp n=1 Tax=Eremothecium sinecaudum TaxID=45286 RepID=A0A109UX63_9SACH|nr:HBL115Cp [Eremothecium sinecaudum]AMD18787.1 HBL115Cp [Eremothecium sinecaudum]
MSDEIARTRSSNSPDVPGPFAREYTLDLPRIPSLELPLKLSPTQASVKKAIEMCGGLNKVKAALSLRGETDVGLELFLNQGRNDDGSKIYFNEHPIVGKRVPQRDESIIMKISLPKGTLARSGGNLARAISSVDPRNVKATPVAIVDNTIKYREMSDFQVRLDNSSSAKDFNSSFGTLNLSNIKTYVNNIPDFDSKPFENVNNVTVDRSVHCPVTDFQLPPIPRFSMVNLPFVYQYKSNPYATKTSSGESKVMGTYIKNYQQFVHDFAPEVDIPHLPHPELVQQYEVAKKTKVYPGSKSDSKFYEKLETCLPILSRLFEKRHVWIKRHIDGIVPQDLHPVLKIGLALVSYRFTKGPWRNTYIRLGVDPRSSNEYAKYQTEYFKIEKRLLKNPAVQKNVPAPPDRFYQSNIEGDIDSRFRFNGKQIPWYLMLQIDLLIEEPNIREVYEKAQYLDTPSELTGWFADLDLAKIRKIVKYELGCMVQGNYEFNEHKLKYFKVMLHVKESDMNKDAEGDVNMDRGDESKHNIDDDDDDNGVETGEIDDPVLEAEEDYDDENNVVATNNGDDDDARDEFDIKTASLDDILDRISKYDQKTANYLQKHLDGFVQETKL